MNAWCVLFAVLQAAVPDVSKLGVIQVSSVAVSPNSVTGGATVNGTVTIAQAAGASGVTVKLQSSNRAIAVTPDNVVVQPGTNSATFIVQTNPVAVNPNVVADPPSVEISAQAGTSTKSVKLTVLPARLAAFIFNPTSVTGGTAATGQVTITGPAPSGGLAIGIALVNPNSPQPSVHDAIALRLQAPLVAVPAQVVVPAGATSATFQANTKGVTANTQVQINASNGVFVTKTATLTLTPPQVASVSLSPTTDPVGGTSVTGTVTMTAAVPADGATIALSIVDTHDYITCGTAPTIPGNVSIPGGASSATFPVNTAPGSIGRYKISAGGKSVVMFVREALVSSSSLDFPQSVKGGTAIQAKLQLNGTQSSCFVGGYQMQSSNTNLAKVPDKVNVPTGSSSASFTITTSAVPTTQTVDISVMGNVGYGYAWVKKTLTLTP